MDKLKLVVKLAAKWIVGHKVFVLALGGWAIAAAEWILSNL